jgi:hypothetical protein
MRSHHLALRSAGMAAKVARISRSSAPDLLLQAGGVGLIDGSVGRVRSAECGGDVGHVAAAIGEILPGMRVDIVAAVPVPGRLSEGAALEADRR